MKIIKKMYTSINNSENKVNIVQLKNTRYAAIKLPSNKFLRIDKMLKSFSQIELKEYVLNSIN